MKRYNDKLGAICLMYTDGVYHCFVDGNDDIFYSDNRPKNLRNKYIYFKTR